MSIVLWVLQVLLAAQFLWHGWIMLAPPAELVDIINANFAPWFRIFIGGTESLGALGLVLPGATRILPWLTSLAAVGLMIVAGSASVYHLSRGEIGSAITTAVLFVLLAFVAYMRWKIKAIAARQTV
ncbi:MAG: DoxX family protein [Chloroflexota bacterium]